MHLAVGWLLWVSQSVDDVRFRVGFRLVAVGWQVWVSRFVGVGPFEG